jgi:hypothetical protein
VTDAGEKPPLDFPELESGGGGAPADEFAAVPSPRRRHPALALGAAALAIFLLYLVHDDVFYALSHFEARDVGEARALAAVAVDKVPVNEYVRLAGMADRESGVIIDTAGSWRFTQFFRLLGTKSRVFVSRVPDPIPVEQAERDVFVGRLVRFRDLSFQAAIRKHFANRVSATHFFAPAVVAAKVAASKGGPLAMADMMGEQVELQPNDQISIDVRRPADVQIEMPRTKWADAAAARAAIEGQGGQVRDEPVQPSDGKSIGLIATFSADVRDQAMHAISELDTRIRFLPVRTTHGVRVADLLAGEDGLVVKAASGDQRLPLNGILAIRTLANVQIPDDALLLREGERPSDQLKIVFVAVFLLGFALLNLLALRVRA